MGGGNENAGGGGGGGGGEAPYIFGPCDFKRGEWLFNV